MSKKNWGTLAPLAVAVLVIAATLIAAPASSIKNGIFWGLLIALAQSYLSTGALAWAWNKNFFYWVWGGGMFFRMIVFAATAYVVYRHTNLSFVATMATMVSATTVFLVVESTAFSSKSK